MTLERRLAMFKRGAEIAGLYNAAWNDIYVCPTCLGSYTEEDARNGTLTEEHAPPESLGGKVMLLTCVTCNSTSGHTLDRHMLAWDQLVTFGTEYSTRPVKAVGTFGSVEQRGEARVTDDSVLFFGVENQNRPGTAESVMSEIEALNRAGGMSGTFSVRFPFNDRRARVGWMRTAYLVAFCQFGYSAICTGAYDVLRRQILDPDAELIDSRVVCLDQTAGRDLRAIGIPVTPEWLGDALIVIAGWMSIIIPRPTAPDDFYDRIAAQLDTQRDTEAKFAWSGRGAEWPERLIATLDTETE